MIKSLKIVQGLKIIVPISVILYVLYRSKQELGNVSIKKSVEALHSLTPGEVIFFILFGIICLGIMSFYDYFLVRSLKINVSTKKAFKVGFIANALNAVLGFGGLAGAGLRTMLYREHTTDTKQLVKGIAWMTTALVNGLSVFALLTLLHVFPVGKLLYEKVWIIPILIIVGAIFPVYMFLNYFSSKKKEELYVVTRFGKTRMASLFSIVSIVEWCGIALLLYLLLRVFEIEIPVHVAMGIFTLSAIAGFASFVPGGFGSFDLAYLLGMNFYGISQEHVLSVLVVYRTVYYLIPFLIALVLTVFEVGGVTLKKIEDKPVIGPAIETTGVIWAIYRELIGKVGYWALAVLVGYVGWTNLYSVWAPALRIGVFNEWLPTWAIQLAYDLAFLCGVILLLNIRGIYHRTKRSYRFVMVTLIVSMMCNIIKSFDYEEAIMAGGVCVILLAAKGQFKRNSLVITLMGYVRNGLIVLSVLVVYYFMGMALTTLEIDAIVRTNMQVVQTILFTIVFLPIAVGVSLNLFENLYREEIGEELQEQKLQEFLKNHTGNYLTHLAFLGDKRLFFSKSGKGCIQFRAKGRHLIVLGDPIGEGEEQRSVLSEFMCEADRFGYLVLFYQVDQSYMHLYHDYGYHFFKLGEEAVVSIDDFSISGKKRSSMRATFNRFEREGYTFTVWSPPFSEDLLKQLKEVSDTWLGKKQEKGFSIGYFNEEYLNRSSIAILADKDEKVIGFVSLMPAYQEGIFSIDLMRYLPDAPSGCMDVIFIHLLRWGKEEGHTHFNMGMAPLSNVGMDQRSFFSERISATVFNTIRYMYSFSGLRKFKDKYHPNWNGKYLAYRKNRTLATSLITVTRLISEGPVQRKKSRGRKFFTFGKSKGYS